MPISFFLALPEAPSPWPGVIVIHEGNGMSPQLLRVCERLAGEGFAALAPDLFARFGGPNPERAGEHYTKLTDDEAMSDVRDAVQALRGLGASKIGITGFCMGGRITYTAAVTPGVEVDAAVPFYGAGIGRRLGLPSCPLLAFFGGHDEWIPTEEIESVRAHHGRDVVVYPDAGHGFMRDGSDGYVEHAARDAWARTLAFFGEHLS